ncbi:hypothetical protein B0H16DRAFT_1833086 [Mycena metata]|uniref:Uncharacterized protein n=1 Tax=Mycena metata TaxID=1033252 RepID=A0AAD7J449_9AGAR|nr:hypothetical protein B0H16DRAFT_1833086 [Mycena metata]
MRMGGTFAQALQLATLIQTQIQSGASALRVKDPTVQQTACGERRAGKVRYENESAAILACACALAENGGQGLRRRPELSYGMGGDEGRGDSEECIGNEGEGEGEERGGQRREDAVGARGPARGGVGCRRRANGRDKGENMVSTRECDCLGRRQFRGQYIPKDFVPAGVDRVEVLRMDEGIESDKGSGELERSVGGKAGTGVESGLARFGDGERRTKRKERVARNESVDGLERKRMSSADGDDEAYVFTSLRVFFHHRLGLSTCAPSAASRLPLPPLPTSLSL